MILVRHQTTVDSQHRSTIAACLQYPSAKVEVIGSQHQNGIVQFARHLQRPPGRTERFDRAQLLRRLSGSVHRDNCAAHFAVELDIDEFVVIAGLIDGALERGERHARCVLGPRALARQLRSATLDVVAKLLRFHYRIHQAPLACAFAADTFGGGAKNIGQIAPHLAFIGEPRETARAWQYAEQRHFGQAHG